jgi:hypothetical protein
MVCSASLSCGPLNIFRVTASAVRCSPLQAQTCSTTAARPDSSWTGDKYTVAFPAPCTEIDLHHLRGCCQVWLKAQVQAPLLTRHPHPRPACAHQTALRPRRRARVCSSGLVGAGGRGSASAKACEAERCFTSADGCPASKCSADADGSRPEQDASQLMFMVAAGLPCSA